MNSRSLTYYLLVHIPNSSQLTIFDDNFTSSSMNNSLRPNAFKLHWLRLKRLFRSSSFILNLVLLVTDLNTQCSPDTFSTALQLKISHCLNWDGSTRNPYKKSIWSYHFILDLSSIWKSFLIDGKNTRFMVNKNVCFWWIVHWIFHLNILHL